MNNFFIVPASLGTEDRFTAHWCALLSTFLRLAKSFVERLFVGRRLHPFAVRAVIDHPKVTASDRPDCMLRTDAFDIVCEHKLSSPVGDRQLERYLSYTGPRTYLALISTQKQQVPRSVIQSDRYLAPPNEFAHFFWRDFYPVVAKCRNPVAKQFQSYMDALGMNPWGWGERGDPLIDVSAASAFRDLYNPLVAALATKGIRSVRRKNSLGLQIRSPCPTVPLFYVAPTQWDGLLNIPLLGRLLVMSVWVRGQGQTLPNQVGFVPGEGPPLFVWTGRGLRANWRPGVFWERDYYASLDDVLLPDDQLSASRLQGVVERALMHLRKGKRAKTTETCTACV